MSQTNQITVDVDEAVAKELAKKDRKIKQLTDENEKLRARGKKLQDQLDSLKTLKDQVVATAETVDEYFSERFEW